MKRKNSGNPGKTSYIFTRETLGITLLLFSALVFIMLLTGRAVFSTPGWAVCTFMYGTFGYGSYFIVALCAYLGVWLAFEKKVKVPVKTAVIISLTALSVFLLFHAVSSRNLSLSNYGEYIKQCYESAAKGYSGYTFGGVISAIIVYPFAKLTTFIGAYVIFSLFVLVCAYFIVYIIRRKVLADRKGETMVAAENARLSEETEKSVEPRETAVDDGVYEVNDNLEIVDTREPYAQPVKEESAPAEDNEFSQRNLGRKILFENGEFAAESYRRNMIFNENSYFNHPVNTDADYLSNFADGSAKPAPKQQTESYTQSYANDVLNRPASSAPTSYVYGETPVDSLDSSAVKNDSQPPVREDYAEQPSDNGNNYGSILNERADNAEKEEPTEEEPRKRPAIDFFKDVTAENTEQPGAETRRDSAEEEFTRREQPSERRVDRNSLRNLFGSSSISGNPNTVEPDVSRLSSRRSENRADIFDDEEHDKDFDIFAGGENASRNSVPERDARIPDLPSPREVSRVNAERAEPEHPREVPAQPAPAEKQPEKPAEEQPKPRHVWKKYVSPSLDLLDDYPENSNINTGEIEENKRTIVDTLKSFKIDSHVSNVVITPSITRYDVIIEDKTNIKRSLSYKEDIAMSLMRENVNAYLNFSKGALSIEVPNKVRSTVGLKSMLVSSKFINSSPNSLTFALGKNIEGEVVCPDITKMPHLLVAGTTGSGKSICLSSLIISLLYKYGPDELRFILVDPKQVEFIPYDKLPHLMINEIIYDVDKAIKALNWAIKEMERRYLLFKQMTQSGIATKTLDEYNAHLPPDGEKLPKIVIILDEFADLMMQAKKSIENCIIRIAQKARACGIHLILATQRPSVDCITGLIKSNLPTRIGFKVKSFDDSRTIFDVGGAEKLLGYGDMYFSSSDKPGLTRIQGCFIDSPEIQRVTDFIKANNETYFDSDVSEFINKVDEEENSDMPEDGSPEDSETKIDESYIEALRFCVTSNQASVSMLQRRFPMGYIKAAKIIDWMQTMNYVTQAEGSKPRKVLLSKDEFDKIYGGSDD